MANTDWNNQRRQHPSFFSLLFENSCTSWCCAMNDGRPSRRKHNVQLLGVDIFLGITSREGQLLYTACGFNLNKMFSSYFNSDVMRTDKGSWTGQNLCQGQQSSSSNSELWVMKWNSPNLIVAIVPPSDRFVFLNFADNRKSKIETEIQRGENLYGLMQIHRGKIF